MHRNRIYVLRTALLFGAALMSAILETNAPLPSAAKECICE
jgi:hypothetical protein